MNVESLFAYAYQGLRHLFGSDGVRVPRWLLLTVMRALRGEHNRRGASCQPSNFHRCQRRRLINGRAVSPLAHCSCAVKLGRTMHLSISSRTKRCFLEELDLPWQRARHPPCRWIELRSLALLLLLLPGRAPAHSSSPPTAALLPLAPERPRRAAQLPPTTPRGATHRAQRAPQLTG